MLDDERFTVPLYTIGLAAAHLGMKANTLRNWVGKSGLVTSVPASGSQPRLPFIALAEGQVYCAFRHAGLSMQATTAGMTVVRKELGERMLQRGVLAHDGREILMNLSGESGADWERARDRQGGLPEVIEIGLRPISWDEYDLPETVHLTAYKDAHIIADPRFAFGQPILEGTTVRVEDVLGLFKAGEPIQVIAAEMDIPPTAVEAMVRTHVALAA